MWFNEELIGWLDFTMSDLDIDALQRICDAATAGDWLVLQDHNGMKAVGYRDSACRGQVQVASYCTYPDAAFIASSRTAFPKALKEIRRLQHDVTQLMQIQSDEQTEWAAKLAALEAEIVALRTRWERAIACVVEDGGDGYAESLSAEWYGLHRAQEIMTGGTNK